MTTRLNIAIIATAVLAILAQVTLFGGLSSAFPAGLMPFAIPLLFVIGYRCFAAGSCPF